ncbi:MAG: cupredoxin domain-containing protein [Actinomycetota bacterium]
MTRRSILVLAATALCALTLPPAPAMAGGGCHEGATTGNGDTVEMKGACFTPTTLHVEPGDTVSFVNLDAMTHNVGGGQWGNFDDMTQGDAFTATFAAEGIFPYACSYHPGMAGAIVVGDGAGAGNGEEVTVASYEAPAASPQVEIRTVAGSPTGDGSNPVGWIAAGAAGLVIGLGAGTFGRRRSERDRAAG